MARKVSFGTCAMCGARAAKAAMAAHLRKCLPRATGVVSEMLLIRAQPPGAPMFWLDCAVAPEAKLKDLDHLLRRTWLECCGHLSAFCAPGGQEVGMNMTVAGALRSAGRRLKYEYDFGSTTELVITILGEAQTAFGKPVRIVARNEPLTWPCDACGKAAAVVCAQCAYEGQGFCCGEHAESHDCGEEMLLPVVNSPRMGVCG